MEHGNVPVVTDGEPPPGQAVTKPAPAGMPSVASSGSSMTDLLRIAVERGTPVAELKELVALHEQMSRRQALQAFTAAMAAFQAECPPIRHSRTAEITTKGGGKYKYTYAEIDEIARTVNPILARHGLSYSWDSTVEKDTLTCVCTVRHIDGHRETATFMLPVENPSAMSPQQKVGAALTFAQRRTLASVLGLTTTDDDGDAGAADPATISDDQLTALEDAIKETGADRARFLQYLRVEKLADLRASEFNRAIGALRQKAAGRRS